jgi:hypothetical protein
MINKNGQTQISFGLIFSMILIIFFIAFAIYGISKFLCISKSAQVELFKNNLQVNINNMRESTQGFSNSSNYYLPIKIEQVCFYDGEFENMYFVPDKFSCDISTRYMLENVNLAKTLDGSADGKLCIETSKGKLYITVKKDYNEDEVTITR